MASRMTSRIRKPDFARGVGPRIYGGRNLGNRIHANAPFFAVFMLVLLSLDRSVLACPRSCVRRWGTRSIDTFPTVPGSSACDRSRWNNASRSTGRVPPRCCLQDSLACPSSRRLEKDFQFLTTEKSKPSVSQQFRRNQSDFCPRPKIVWPNARHNFAPLLQFIDIRNSHAGTVPPRATLMRRFRWRNRFPLLS